MKGTNLKIIKFVIMCWIASSIVFSSGLKAAEISRDAKRHMFRGQAAMEEAKDATGYKDASAEFKKAIEYAPDWSDVWFNLGVAQESAGDYTGAIESFNKYLKLNPTSADSSEVEGRIFKLEYKAELKTEEKKLPSIAGKWRLSEVDGYAFSGSVYYRITASGNSFRAEQINKPVQGVDHIEGTINGNKLQGTVFIDHTWFQNGKSYTRAMTGTIIPDGKTIKFKYTMIDAMEVVGRRIVNLSNYNKEEVFIRE